MITCDLCGLPIDTTNGYYSATPTMIVGGETALSYQFHKECIKNLKKPSN
jgi:hypothetical protein